MRIGVLGALPEEVASVVRMLEHPESRRAGGRNFCSARFLAHEVVVAHSRIGKVAAAASTVELVTGCAVDQVIFLGVAGSLRDDLSAGDIVVAERLVQHDLDASPLFPPMEIPLLGRAFLDADPEVSDALAEAALAFIAEDHPLLSHAGHGPAPPRLVRGDVATGDQFIAGAAARQRVRERAPTALCVEMEGAAVAQVCHEYGIPLGVVRVLSDDAGESAPAAFAGSLERFAGACAAGITERYLRAL
jgi:adenosylhomocysteine nucleosidase